MAKRDCDGTSGFVRFLYLWQASEARSPMLGAKMLQSRPDGRRQAARQRRFRLCSPILPGVAARPTVVARLDDGEDG